MLRLYQIFHFFDNLRTNLLVHKCFGKIKAPFVELSGQLDSWREIQFKMLLNALNCRILYTKRSRGALSRTHAI